MKTKQEKNKISRKPIKESLFKHNPKNESRKKESNIIFVDWEKEVEHSTEYEKAPIHNSQNVSRKPKI